MMIICNDILLMGKRYYSFGLKHKLGDRSLVFILPALAKASLYEGAGFYWGMRIGVIIIIIMSLFKDLNNDYYIIGIIKDSGVCTEREIMRILVGVKSCYSFLYL